MITLVQGQNKNRPYEKARREPDSRSDNCDDEVRNSSSQDSSYAELVRLWALKDSSSCLAPIEKYVFIHDSSLPGPKPSSSDIPDT